jgi:hypothetical protein
MLSRALHGGSPGRIAEVVCDMSGTFIAAVGESFETTTVTVDWFHVVQMFTKAVDQVRRAEARQNNLPKALRGAVLKRADGRLTEAQVSRPNWRPPTCSPPQPDGSPTSSATQASFSIRIGRSIRSARPSLPSGPTLAASCNAGPRHTAMPDWRVSTASSRPPGHAPAAIETSQPSPPSSTCSQRRSVTSSNPLETSKN